MEALEQRARLDPNRLPRGRTYARSGRVGELSMAPGEVRAAVRGTRSLPYRVRLRVREFTAREWEVALAAIAAQAGYAAALLDGALEPGVLGALAGAGVALLPTAGELGPSCSCPDWANPCKHAAAVCYLVAERMDADPFTILLLRGRGRTEILAGVRALRSSNGAGPGEGAPAALPRPAEGILAREAFAAAADRPPLPLPLTPGDHPGRPAQIPPGPGQEGALLAAQLAELAADATWRAFQVIWGLGDHGLDLTPGADLARVSAARLGSSNFDEFARRSGVPARLLMRWALAWRAGGRAALEVLEGDPWSPSADEMEEGRAAMEASFGRVTVRGERVTNLKAGLQLRYAPEGLWYLLVRRGAAWEIHEPPASDPRSLLGPLAEEASRAAATSSPPVSAGSPTGSQATLAHRAGGRGPRGRSLPG